MPLEYQIASNVFLAIIYFSIHSLMARSSFKGWWNSHFHFAMQRAFYIFISGITTITFLYLWFPLPNLFIEFSHPITKMFVIIFHVSGWVLIFSSTFVIDHFSFFGIRQTWRNMVGKTSVDPPFTVKYMYAVIRHPISLGWLMVFWSSPNFTYGNLLLAILSTGYILIVTPIEEKDLVRTIGKSYLDYKEKVPKILPLPRLKNKN
ncbi:methyltransferase family protein [Aliiglaciecola sp. M165]|uniref:methyltransferase family protein n=1 Tax=Aliiglaciecola sp. M165 TaxID=2593649 RepID=UPI00117D01C4|nr:hypothetical protein [Aliiglaciecola sp. M165]TRY31415.1 hypothetical protein FM019_11105 [Aliiglaciecola sp. M165]